MIVLWAGVVLGLAVLINFIFIVKKWKAQRYADAVVDIATIFITSGIYGMSLMGGAIATLGSMFISIYLNFKPLNLFEDSEEKKKETLARSWAEKVDNLFD